MTANTTGRKEGNRRLSAQSFSRRKFMKNAAGVAAFTFVPKHVLGAAGRPSANNKLNIAGIGVGGQGAGDLQNVSSENIVALCDSYANSPRLIPEARMKDYQRPDKSIPRPAGHHKEWIEACKGGQPAGSNFDYAGPMTEVILLGNIAVRMSLKTQEKGLRLAYDGPNMRITNLAEANEYLHRKCRDRWTL